MKLKIRRRNQKRLKIISRKNEKRIKDKYLKCCRRFNFSPISSGKFPLKAFRKMNLENPNLEEYVVRGKREKF